MTAMPTQAPTTAGMDLPTRPAGALRAGAISQLLLAAACLALGGLLLATLRDGLSTVSFSDEAAQVVGGKILNAGGRLYRDFVDSHGPFIFMLAQFYGHLFGWAHTNGVRIINLLFVLASLASIAASPALRGRQSRLLAVAVFCALLAPVWIRQGMFLFNFYSIAGALAGIVLSGFALGAQSGRTAPFHALIAGIAASCLVDTAYSFGPSSVLFSAAGIWLALCGRHRRPILFFGAGVAGSALALALYLHLYADLHGYLAFHFAENQFIYARYISFSLWQFRRSLMLSLAPQDRIQSLGVILTLASFGMVVAAEYLHRRPRWPLRLPAIAALFAAILLLNSRGSTQFQDVTFLYAALVMFALATGALVPRLPHRAALAGYALLAAFLLAVNLSAQGALYTPFRMTSAVMQATPHWPIGDRSDAELFRAIRAHAAPGERILALTYNPQVYLLADRLPMNGFYAWFRWDADYSRHPYFGRPRDLCQALADRPPPVIVFDDYPVWGYKPADYAPCLFTTLQSRYTLQTAIADVHGKLYIRNDRLAH